MLAPIILFVYNRPEHTKRTLDALKKNKLAIESDLFIFADGAKNHNSAQGVDEVRSLINNADLNLYFRSVKVYESDSNKGLATSVINGVNEVINVYKKVIVIEDDCVSTNDFLNFMNDALTYYEKNSTVFSIGGYSVPLRFPDEYIKKFYAMGRTCSYAWGTWIDRWNLIDWNVSDHNKFKYNLIKRYQFNKFGNDRSLMLDLQMNNVINSWAIRFCYTMFKNKMVTIYPRNSRVKNIGHDGSGTHNNENSNNTFLTEIRDNNPDVEFGDAKIDKELTKQFVCKFHIKFINKVKVFVKHIILKRV